MEIPEFPCACASVTQLKEVYTYSVADVLALARENGDVQRIMGVLRAVQVSLVSMHKSLQANGGKKGNKSYSSHAVRWSCSDVVHAAEELSRIKVNESNQQLLLVWRLLVADYLHLLMLTHLQTHTMLRLQAHFCDINDFSAAVGAVLHALANVYDTVTDKVLLRLLIRQAWFHLNQTDSYDSVHFSAVLHVMKQLRIQVDSTEQELRFCRYEQIQEEATVQISNVIDLHNRPGLLTSDAYDSDDEVTNETETMISILYPVASLSGMYSHMTDTEARQYTKSHKIEHVMVCNIISIFTHTFRCALL